MPYARNFLSASPDAMIIADQNGCIVHLNSAAEKMFGLRADRDLGKSLDLIVPGPMRGAHADGIKRLIAGGEPKLPGRVVHVIAQDIEGRTFPVELSLSMWWEDGTLRFGAILRDVSDRREEADRLRHLAHYDSLTLLPNRASLIKLLDQFLTEKKRLTLFLIDLDGFKEINDRLGHDAGDAVLSETARRIRGFAKTDGSLTARLGGDEFAILLPEGEEPCDAHEFAESISSALQHPLHLKGETLVLSCSCGIAHAPDHGTDSATLMGSAYLALEKARTATGKKICHFEPALKMAAVAKRTLEIELRNAWDRNEFELFYQPQVALKDKRIVGAEALLRWRHPIRGVLAPGAFLSTLERSSVAPAVGDWILQTACRQAAVWSRWIPDFSIGVNLFDVQFRNNMLKSSVRKALHESGLAPSQLEIEVTENIMLDETGPALQQLIDLRRLGAMIAFDDYGTGYASLAILKHYPITRLKIDREFMKSVEATGKDAAIVNAIIMLARRFGLSVIAEGVESLEQELLLSKWRCPHAQGYLYGRPMPASEFEALLRDRTSAALTRAS